MIINKKVYRKKSSSGIGLRRKQLSASGSSWLDSDRPLSPSPSVPSMAIDSFEEHPCVFVTAHPTSTHVSRNRSQVKPKLLRRRSLHDVGVLVLAPAASVAIVEQDLLELSFSSTGHDSSSSSSSMSPCKSYSGRKERSKGDG